MLLRTCTTRTTGRARDALRRRPDRGADDGERGAALASVLAIVAVLAVVSVTLLATATFSTGFAGANRAGVQARAAAEGGVDHALLNLATCVSGVITSPAGTAPVFRVEVDWHATNGPWREDECPTSAAAEVRLTSTGTAADPGVDGEAASRTRTVEAVAKPLPAITAGTSLRLVAPLSVLGQGTTNADVSVQGDVTCAETRPALTHTGTLYVSGTYTPSSPCSTQGAPVVGPFDPSSPALAFPRITRSDSRWWKRYFVPNFQDFVKYWTDDYYNFCNFSGWGARSSDSPLGVVADSTSDCPGGVTMRTAKPGEPYPPLVVTLNGDVTLLVNKFTLDGPIRFEAAAGTGEKEFAVSIVSPWPDTATSCESRTPNIVIRNGGIVTGPRTRVLLYSAQGVQLGASPEERATTGAPVGPTQDFRGQIIGCGVSLQDPTTLTYAPVGRSMQAPDAVPPMQVVSKRDVTS
ncbi:pilus assembly PilX N-terminal domain-containing protein [Cellulomonas endophytica]|uniref:pilus assembly PilX N-terminal domain-containing protein n=1 Tax=Cellulomonas endophytica TaxID=2494735 RepID=UPI0010105E3F|nr:pilus assembly PilX N-terminal domain-containing protein [Cellulomonas endophytica]